MATFSQVRQNFSEEVEEGINGQINMELYASYTYLSMVIFKDNYIDYATHPFFSIGFLFR